MLILNDSYNLLLIVRIVFLKIYCGKISLIYNLKLLLKSYLI